MSKFKKLVFFGNERLATGIEHSNTPTLKALIEYDYEVAAVISHYSKGHSRNARPLEVAEVAKQNNIPLFLPENLKDIKTELEELRADAGVLVAYGKIIPEEIIDIFPRGIINIHPSLLPKYRGPIPIEQAILDGVLETGTSIMRLAQQMDAGPIFIQDSLKLYGQESKAELAESLLEMGSHLLLKSLPNILDDTLKPIQQDDSKATYTNLMSKADGIIEWKQPADVIERQIRAFLNFPKSRAVIFNHDIVITKARTAKNKDDGDLVIECQPGWLEIQGLTAPSGRSISGAEFIRGYSK